MIEIVEAISSAIATGTNPVTAIREAFNYSVEELAVTSGLATQELAALETTDPDQAALSRIESSLGLPAGVASGA
jgi:hypothetical protein